MLPAGLARALLLVSHSHAGRIFPVHSRVLCTAAYTLDLAGAGVIGACSRASLGDRDPRTPGRAPCPLLPPAPVDGTAAVAQRTAAGWGEVPRPSERDASSPGRGTSDRSLPNVVPDTYVPRVTQRLAASPGSCRRFQALLGLGTVQAGKKLASWLGVLPGCPPGSSALTATSSRH
jgi:hypothetical protein